VSLSKREIALFGLLIVVSVIYLLYYFVFHPLNLQTTQMKAENSSLSKELQALQVKGAWPGDIGLEKQQIWDEYEKVVTKVPQSPMIPNIIDFMELSAREAHVKLLSISYKESSTIKTAMDVKKSETASADQGKLTAQYADFQLTASGTHLNLLSFLLKIENAPRIYKINSSKMTMIRNNQQKMGSRVEASMQEGNSGKMEASLEIAVKESSAYDPINAEVNLEFTAYYDTASGISAKSSVGK